MFACLPFDLILKILLLLPYEAIIHLACSSKRIAVVSRDTRVWKALLHRDFPYVLNSKLYYITSDSQFREYYELRLLKQLASSIPEYSKYNDIEDIDPRLIAINERILELLMKNGYRKVVVRRIPESLIAKISGGQVLLDEKKQTYHTIAIETERHNRKIKSLEKRTKIQVQELKCYHIYFPTGTKITRDNAHIFVQKAMGADYIPKSGHLFKLFSPPLHYVLYTVYVYLGYGEINYSVAPYHAIPYGLDADMKTTDLNKLYPSYTTVIIN